MTNEFEFDIINHVRSDQINLSKVAKDVKNMFFGIPTTEELRTYFGYPKSKYRKRFVVRTSVRIIIPE